MSCYLYTRPNTLRGRNEELLEREDVVIELRDLVDVMNVSGVVEGLEMMVEKVIKMVEWLVVKEMVEEEMLV